MKGARHVVVPETALPSVIILEVATLIVYAASWACLKRAEIAALWTSAFWIIFFAYYDVSTGLAQLFPGMPPATAEIVSLCVYVFIAIFALAGLTKKSWKFGKNEFEPPMDAISSALNPVAIVLFLMNLYPVASYYFSVDEQAQKTIKHYRSATDNWSVLFSEQRRPDVYYIILDGYAHPENLKNVCGYDNSEFLKQLESRGFQIIQKAASNYFKTAPSLSSSLNMNYLEEIPQAVGNEPCADFVTMRLVQNNALFNFLKASKLYKVINICSGQPETESIPAADQNVSTGLANHFTIALLTISPLRATERFFPSLRNIYASRHLSQGAALENVCKAPEQKFVFMHSEMTHPPYLFDKDGNPKPLLIEGMQSNWKTPQEYADQIKFAEKNVLRWVDALMKEERNGLKPVIILQADHGPGPFEANPQTQTLSPEDRFKYDVNLRMKIFHAINPGSLEKKFVPYEGQTPVNTFRLLMDPVHILQRPTSHQGAPAPVPKVEDKSLFPAAGDPNFSSAKDKLEDVSKLLVY